MSIDTISIVYKIGDRVSREVFMDDGTWQREGDSCLARSPRRFGYVTNISDDGLYGVQWDDGAYGDIRYYFGSGIDRVDNKEQIR